MSPPLFLVAAGELGGDQVVLSGPEGKHAAAVRRLRPGETVDLADGAGQRARCTVSQVASDRTSVTFSPQEIWTDPHPQPVLTVIQALPKGEDAELAVELLTEAGVDRIVPWEAQRCVARWRAEGGRMDKALRKWRTTARESAKQSRRSRIPEVTELVRGHAVTDVLARADLALVLDSAEGADGVGVPVPLPTVTPPANGEVVVLVGPEGGFSPAEYQACAAVPAQPVRLGSAVLRSATAGFAALTLLQAGSGRW